MTRESLVSTAPFGFGSGVWWHSVRAVRSCGGLPKRCEVVLVALLHENLPLGVVGPVCVHLGPFFVGRRRAAEYPVVHRRRHVGKFFVLRGATDRDAARGSAGAGRHAVHPCFYDGAGVFAVSLGVDHGDVSDDDRCAPPSERARDGEDRVAERGRPGTGDFSRGRILYVHRQRAAGCGAPGEGSEGEEGRRGRRPCRRVYRRRM